MSATGDGFDTVVVVDFGAQYAQLIARRVRECNVFSEIMPSTASAAEIAARRPKAVILSGGPSSVYAEGAPQVATGLFETGVATLGICYGFQAMAETLGGRVEQTGGRGDGGTPLPLGSGGGVFAGVPHGEDGGVVPR